MGTWRPAHTPPAYGLSGRVNSAPAAPVSSPLIRAEGARPEGQHTVPHCPWVHSPCPTVPSQPLGSRLCSVHHPSWCPSPRLSGDPTSRGAPLSPPLHALCDPLQAPVQGRMQLHPRASRCHWRDKLGGPGSPTPLPLPSPTTLDLVTQRGRWWGEASPSVRVGEQWDHKSWYRNVLGLPEPRAGCVMLRRCTGPGGPEC